MIRQFVIFGATGDLTIRKLLPAIGELFADGRLPDDFSIVGVSYEDFDSGSFREQVRKELPKKAPSLSAKLRDAILCRLDYRRADVRKPEDVAAAVARGSEPIVAYLALPPQFFEPAIRALAGCDLPDGSRIVVEKPFGQDLASARKLNDLLHRSFAEENVFRLDHFLGRQTVQNILGLRFANRIFEPLWTNTHVERVEIVWDEVLGLEGRAGYYDRTGALKDMVQNHLLQLLALVAMEPPITLSPRDFRDRKTDVLRAVRRLTPAEIREQTVRGRYIAGERNGKPIPGYLEEDGVDPENGTETFAQVELRIDNWRWAGVPFLLRSGKALKKERKEIAIHFHPVPHLTFDNGEQPHANLLRLAINPDRMELQVNINGPGDPLQLEDALLATRLAPEGVPAYGRLLYDVLHGQPTFTIRDDEVEESWAIIEPILKAWKSGEVPLREYAAGSTGPG